MKTLAMLFALIALCLFFAIFIGGTIGEYVRVAYIAPITDAFTIR